MKNPSVAVGMSAKPVMADGKARRDGGHGGEECGGFRWAKEMDRMGGCRRRWASIGGVVLRTTSWVRLRATGATNMPDTRTPIERMIDKACGYVPGQCLWPPNTQPSGGTNHQ